jgi:hypothetical protein
LRNEWSSSFWRSASETSKIRPLRASLAFFKPVVRLTSVLPTLYHHVSRCAPRQMRWVCAYSRTLKDDGALSEYQSLRANGSTRFFRPFLPLDNLLFFPTAMFAAVVEKNQVL